MLRTKNINKNRKNPKPYSPSSLECSKSQVKTERDIRFGSKWMFDFLSLTVTLPTVIFICKIEHTICFHLRELL